MRDSIGHAIQVQAWAAFDKWCREHADECEGLDAVECATLYYRSVTDTKENPLK